MAEGWRYEDGQFLLRATDLVSFTVEGNVAYRVDRGSEVTPLGSFTNKVAAMSHCETLADEIEGGE